MCVPRLLTDPHLPERSICLYFYVCAMPDAILRVCMCVCVCHVPGDDPFDKFSVVLVTASQTSGERIKSLMSDTLDKMGFQ